MNLFGRFQAPARPNLNEFNRLVLAHQDEAYTLAYYLLGEEQAACQVVQAAVLDAYQKFAGAEGFRRQLLGLICAACKLEDRRVQLSGVPVREQRLALALVDRLGLSYREAAVVLQENPDQVARWLAWGRRASAADPIETNPH